MRVVVAAAAQVHEGLRQFLQDLAEELAPLPTLPGNAAKVTRI
jgi:hypothetical protein